MIIMFIAFFWTYHRQKEFFRKRWKAIHGSAYTGILNAESLKNGVWDKQDVYLNILAQRIVYTRASAFFLVAVALFFVVLRIVGIF